MLPGGLGGGHAVGLAARRAQQQDVAGRQLSRRLQECWQKAQPAACMQAGRHSGACARHKLRGQSARARLAGGSAAGQVPHRSCVSLKRVRSTVMKSTLLRMMPLSAFTTATCAARQWQGGHLSGGTGLPHAAVRRLLSEAQGLESPSCVIRPCRWLRRGPSPVSSRAHVADPAVCDIIDGDGVGAARPEVLRKGACGRRAPREKVDGACTGAREGRWAPDRPRSSPCLPLPPVPPRQGLGCS